MTKEDIIECLNHPKDGEKSRKLLAFCSVPRTYNEMERGSNVKGSGLFKSLVELKKSGAIAFADGKYFTTQLGLETLKSLQ
ncbi:hypothetical protein MUP77_24600 [Candidatus Bathyarchaeota archaeon]|nr:hypothetical protein [Candidatus Bathyarchaeota archaeon]